MASPQPPTHAPTILVADDDQDLLSSVSTVLQKNGYAVVTVDSGAKAIAVLEQHALNPALPEVHVILSDLVMPEMDGVEFLTVVRSGQFRNIPFVILSGALDRAHVEKLIELEVDGILYKPFESKKLLATIQAAILRRQDKIINAF